MRIGVIVSNAAAAAPTHTTVHLIAAALAMGHAVDVFEPWDFEITPAGAVHGRAHRLPAGLPPAGARDGVVATLHARSHLRRGVPLDTLDLLLLRANPYQDAILTFALLAQAAGVRVVNEPRGLPRTSHKAYVATLAGVPRPRTLVTRSRASAFAFCAASPEGIIVKPARSCGGRGVSLLRGPRRASRLDAALGRASAASGDRYTIVQAYLPEAILGERRLLWLDGVLLGGYLRQRAPGDFRHNLQVGGQPLPCTIGADDVALCDTLTPHLRRDGVRFAGIDVIGGLVVEVNTLNPGGAHYTEQYTGAPIAPRIIAALAAQP